MKAAEKISSNKRNTGTVIQISWQCSLVQCGVLLQGITDVLIFFFLSSVSHSQITRLYSRFTSLDKGENGTLR